MAMSPDIVASWSVSLPDGIHSIKFEHGTTTGKRVVWVDNKEILRKNWMFKLVGKIEFAVSKSKALICLLYTSPSPRDKRQSRMPSSA